MWCGTPEPTVGLVNGGWGVVYHESKQLPNYLTNGDEIRRLIGKQHDNVLNLRIENILKGELQCDRLFLATPEQLAEALLNATGNWVE